MSENQGAWFLIKVPKKIYTLTHGAPTLGRFLYLRLIEQKHYYWVSMWQIHVAMMTCELLLTWEEYTFVKVYFDMSSKSIKEDSSWHGWNIIRICLLAPTHRHDSHSHVHHKTITRSHVCIHPFRSSSIMCFVKTGDSFVLHAWHKLAKGAPICWMLISSSFCLHIVFRNYCYNWYCLLTMVTSICWIKAPPNS